MHLYFMLRCLSYFSGYVWSFGFKLLSDAFLEMGG
jgi:hypothetical protein